MEFSYLGGKVFFITLSLLLWPKSQFRKKIPVVLYVVYIKLYLIFMLHSCYTEYSQAHSYIQGFSRLLAAVAFQSSSGQANHKNKLFFLGRGRGWDLLLFQEVITPDMLVNVINIVCNDTSFLFV